VNGRSQDVVACGASSLIDRCGCDYERQLVVRVGNLKSTLSLSRKYFVQEPEFP